MVRKGGGNMRGLKLSKLQIVIISGSLLCAALMFHLLGWNGWKTSALIIATIVSGSSIAKIAVQTLFMKMFSIELLVTIAVIGALIIGEYVEAGAVTFLFLFGAYLEARTIEKTRSSLQTLMDMTPQQATVLKNGKSVVTEIDDINVGDRILIQSGEKIAIDGRIVLGHASINESAITGESVPVSKETSDKVFSGTIIDHGYVEVIAEKVGDDTAFAKIIELVEEAQEGKARTQKFLERFANVYTPGILILAIIVFIFTKNIELSLTFLVIACPGALVISAPVSLVSGIGNGARQGALLKGGEVIENLAKVDVVVFDKTGTLTKGNPTVVNIQTYGMDETQLLKITAEAERISEHHLGQTIVKEAETRGIPLINDPSDFMVEKGHGIQAHVNEQTILAGNRKLLEKNNVTLPVSIDDQAKRYEKKGHTVIFVSINDQVKGIISIADEVRAEAVQTIAELKALGIKKVIMLTGDNQFTAGKVAKQLGVDVVHAEMLPEDKVNQIKALKREGYRVGMVGDGINDAPAIALADVGMAMGVAGTDVAMETADVVLMSDQLNRIPYAHALAKATVRNMKQNMFFAVGTVAILLAGVLLGKVFLASGMLIHELSVLLVVINAVRLVSFRKRPQTTQTNKRHRVMIEAS